MATHATFPCCRRSIVNGQEVLVIETSSGQQITLQNAPASVLIQDTNGNVIRFNAAGITITSSATLNISASQIQISAGEVTINAAMTQFSGVVQADTVLANSVIQSQGNIW
ncbi:hypothetical protein H7849_23900 [Alloacidobacterium dinghuense]|uniref:DUF2345 domain-containing protein n=1 Tax=Alloacidobacterium dinghuense TaxID=2763107 RepID=A0A7G8BHJ9_9BACT|nr:hypothetical protein [Alloacidobacterium dinghuense]QNI32019.1 hypothetical protein H7849_23900 [Alloacidobacterium dinghuense]